MRFPDNILANDEHVERDLRPHWMTVVLPALIGVLIIALTVLSAWLTPDTQGWNIFQWVVIAVAAILLIALVVVPFLTWRTTRYVVTNKRVVVRRGILAKQGKDIALAKITDVSFRQSLFDRIIRSGTLTVESAGDAPDEEFKNIPRSNQVQQLINRLVEQDIDSRGFVGGMGRQSRFAAGGHGRDPISDSSSYRAPAPPQTPDVRPQQHVAHSGPEQQFGPPQQSGSRQSGPQQSGAQQFGAQQFGGQQQDSRPHRPPPEQQPGQASGQWQAPGPAAGSWETPPR